MRRPEQPAVCPVVCLAGCPGKLTEVGDRGLLPHAVDRGKGFAHSDSEPSFRIEVAIPATSDAHEAPVTSRVAEDAVIVDVVPVDRRTKEVAPRTGDAWDAHGRRAVAWFAGNLAYPAPPESVRGHHPEAPARACEEGSVPAPAGFDPLGTVPRLDEVALALGVCDPAEVHPSRP